MMRWLSACLLWLLTSAGFAQSVDPYDTLRHRGDGFEQVTPGRVFTFPQDHQPHPGYRIEWWYLTGNLADEAGRRWGIQWTLFRSQQSPDPDPGGWSSNVVWMAHAAVTTPEGHRHARRYARGGIGQAGVGLDDGGFRAWLDDWQLRARGADMFPAQLVFDAEGAQVELMIASETPYVLQGSGGFSQKSTQGQASYYYSQPHLRLSGRITVDGQPVAVHGEGWLDREWSSQPLADNQQGWDWFSLHLADGHALMVYRLRHDDGQHWLSGSWVTPAGESTTLGPEDISLEVLERRLVKTPGASNPDETRELPLRWMVSLPRMGKSWRVEATQDDQWMGGQFPYWEGVVTINGGRDGVGYLEMTGYPAR